MRRHWVWIAGLGLATGSWATPAWSQSGVTAPTASPRAARLGLPVAVTAAEPSSSTPTMGSAIFPVGPATGYTFPAPSLPGNRWGEQMPVPAPAATLLPAAVLTGDDLVMPGTPIAAVIPSVQPPSAVNFAVPGVPNAPTGANLPSVSGVIWTHPSVVQWPPNNGTVPIGSGGTPAVLPMPTIMGGQTAPLQSYPNQGPNITEIRSPMTAPAGNPSSPAGGSPSAVVTYVPSVLPGTGVLASPGLEVPLYAPVGLEALQRLTAPSKYYAGAEFLLWWTKSAHLPPLLTTSSPQFQGIPGFGDTRVLFGGNFGNTLHTGGRFTIGRWFGDDQIRGVEGRLFFLGQTDSTFAVTSAEYPVLARPFFNVNTPFGPLSEVIASPGRGLGAAIIDLQNDVWGAEVNYRRNLWRSCCARLDALVGYRYFGMKERLGITESFISTGANPIRINGIPLASGTINDIFRAENHFHGGQFGLAWEHRWGLWTFDARATVAFGNVTQLGEIDGGQTLLLANGQTVRYAGGLLALPNANIGRHTHNQFAVLPEVGVNIGYQLTSQMRLFVGYNFLYLGNALRPERMIDTNIDIARIPNFAVPGGGTTPIAGIPRPAPLFRTNDFFVQGIHFGLEFRW